jgi:hypothetical protein
MQSVSARIRRGALMGGWAFVPEGHHDNPGTKCLGLKFGHLQKITSGDFAPKGLEDSAQGFNPGNRSLATRPEGAEDRMCQQR